MIKKPCDLNTDVGHDTLILDLGCGDGRVLTAAALARGCRGVGVDISAVRLCARAQVS